MVCISLSPENAEERSVFMTGVMWKGEIPFWHPARQGAFILDWDGVLAETSLDFRPIFAKYFGGKRVMLLETLPSLESSRRKCIEQELVNLEMEGARKAHPVPGALELLEFLRERHIPWAVVSRNCEAAIRLAAQSSGITLPAHTFTRDQEPVKPDPRALWNAASALGVSPERCVMVGDFLYDLMGAKRGGMRGVLVQRDEPSWLSWADLAFSTLREFVAFLSSDEPVHPWEYRHIASSAELRRRWNFSFSLPEDAEDPGALAFGAASWGCKALGVSPEERLSPSQWMRWHGLEASFLGKPLEEVLRHSLGSRFPFLALREPAEEDLPLPPKVEDLPAFLESLE
jgi:HAD superfamily hydrolase (TIGR01509 family)